MKIFINYIIKNIQHVIYLLLLSTFFVFLIFPALTRLDFIENFPINPATDALMAIDALILSLLMLSWRRLQKLWQRYKNTYDLEDPPFICIDSIVLFISFSAFLIILFQAEYISIPNISLKFKVFAFINFIFIISWFLSSFHWKHNKKEQPILRKDKYSLYDEPIQFLEQDLLGREKFIEDLQKGIESLSFDDSFVFGLYGSWGEGKTSVINLLKNKFKENKDYLVINFDPWYFKDEEAILAAFYNQIEQSLSLKFILPGFKKTSMKYQNLISMGLSQTGITINFSDTKESIEEIRQRIESYIAQTKKKIIIFIDDIDRLQPEEVLFVFKLVRLNAKFQNTIFLLAFDPVIVQDYFIDNLKIDSEFLEKIVQKPIPLPAIEQQDIGQFLDNHIEKLFDELVISKERRKKFEEDFSVIYRTQVKKIFKTLRRAKRYLNGLRSTLPTIKNEINLKDFLILEIIRNFFPKIYDDIWSNPWSYLTTKWDIEFYFSSPFALSLKDDRKYEIIKDHIESITENEKDREILKELLKELFFEVKDALEQHKLGQKYSAETYRVEKCITHPECFKKYFMLKVTSSDISDEFIETTLNLWNDQTESEREKTISEAIYNLKERKKLSKFFNKLLIFIEKITTELSYEIIKFIYKNANNFSKKDSNTIESSEYRSSFKLFMHLINNNIEKDKINGFLEEAVMSTPYLPFAVPIINYCQKSHGSFFNIYESVDIDKLKEKVLKRLKEYFVDNKRDIFEIQEKEGGWIFVLYEWGSNWGTFKGNNNKIVNKYVLSIIKDNAKRFVEFLMSQKGISFEEKMVFNMKDISRIYSIEDLNKLAEKFKNDPALSNKEKETIEIFLKTYQTYKNNK